MWRGGGEVWELLVDEARNLVMPVEPRGGSGMIWGACESSEKVHMVDA
jgi:hypothetical protein